MAKRVTKEIPSDDEIRGKVLQYFYDRYRNSRGQRGKNGIQTKVSIIKSDLKEKHGYSQQQITSALYYLKGEEWVDEIPQTVEVFVNGIKRPNTVNWYGISSAGINKIEGKGKYAKKEAVAIKVKASGKAVVTIGDGNKVRVKHKDAAESLVKLKNHIESSSEIDDESRNEIIADIDTIEAQLRKEEPNKSIVQECWIAIEKSVTIASATEYLYQAGNFLAGFLS